MAKSFLAPSVQDRATASQTKLLKAFAAKAVDVNDESRRIKFVITTNDVDRDNDIIDVNGWNFENYLKNPVVLWAHNSSMPPIARCVSLSRDANSVIAVAEFMPDDMNAFAGSIYRMIKGGFLNAVSVGFRCTRYAINEERRGVDFLEQELLEFSVCPVPANQNALVAASADGIDLEPLREWVQTTIEAWPGDLKMRGKAWRKLVSEPLPLEESGLRKRVKMGDLEIEVNVNSAEALDHLKAVQQLVDELTEKGAKLDAILKGLPLGAVPEDASADADGAKRGRVLSQANERRLTAAMTHAGNCASAIKEALDSVRRDDEEPPPAEDEDESASAGVPAVKDGDIEDATLNDDGSIELAGDADDDVIELDGEVVDIEDENEAEFEIDEDELKRLLTETVVGTMGDLAREAAKRTMNQMRGRLD